jgi:hypothetical protein
VPNTPAELFFVEEEEFLLLLLSAGVFPVEIADPAEEVPEGAKAVGIFEIVAHVPPLVVLLGS